MLQEGIAPETEAPFRLLGGVSTTAAIPAEVSRENIPENLARGHPRLHHLPGWKELKGTETIALIGGGPTLQNTHIELKDFPVTMAAGSTHDWLVDHGHHPTFCTIADPDKVCANYLRKASPKTTYLVASQCHPAVFDALEGCPIRLWHLYPCDHEFLTKHDPQWEAVGGGCTVGLRNVSIAIMMGYKEVHFFGYDSCYAINGRSHVQDFSEEGEEEFLGDTYKVAVGIGLDGLEAGTKIFTCAGYQMAQAQHFKDTFAYYGHIINPTFHGDGLLAEFCRQYEILRKREAEVACPT